MSAFPLLQVKRGLGGEALNLNPNYGIREEEKMRSSLSLAYRILNTAYLILLMNNESQTKLNLIILSAIIFIMAGLRVVYSGTLTNLFVYWNLFLALISFYFIHLFKLIASKKDISAKLRNLALVLAFFGWLSLIPNAIYLVTDLGHLNGPRLVENSRYNPYKKKIVAKREVPYLYDISMLFLLALLGFMASGIQTNQMFHALEKTNLGEHIKFNKKTELAYLSLVSLAVSLAVFLGRYLRWNSWDLIINPLPILKDLFFYLVHPLASPNLYAVGILFFVLSAAAHQIFKTSE